MLNVQTRLIIITITTALLSANAVGAYDPNNFDSANAAHWYRKAIALYQSPEETLDLNAYAYKDAESTPELEQYLKSQKQVIKLVTKAAQINNCDWQFDFYEDIWRGMTDYSYTTKKCWYVILADTRFSEDSLNPSGVIERCRLCLNSAQHIYIPNVWDYLSSISLKNTCLLFIQEYLIRHPEIQTADLEKLNKLLSDEYKRKPITLNALLDSQLEFAQKALTEHKDQRPNDPFVDKIMALNGEAGWDEFFSSNLSYYEKRINNLRVASMMPIGLRYWTISITEQQLNSETDSILERYEDESKFDEPTQKDYDDFIKDCGCFFSIYTDPPFGLIYSCQIGMQTKRNALLTAIPLMIEYRKSGKLPDNVPLNSPKDAFGDQTFELIKTDTGFTLKSKSIDVRQDKRHEYEFKLPKK